VVSFPETGLGLGSRGAPSLSDHFFFKFGLVFFVLKFPL